MELVYNRWGYFFPLRGESIGDKRSMIVLSLYSTPESIARFAAEREDVREEERIVIVSPYGHQYTFDVEVPVYKWHHRAAIYFVLKLVRLRWWICGTSTPVVSDDF